MGQSRKFTPHTRWTPGEIQIVQDEYATASWGDLLNLLPGRNIKMIQGKANALGLHRRREPKMTDAERLRRKRDAMAARRLADPDGVRARSRRWHQENRDRQCEKMRGYYARRFFWGKAMHLRGADRATYIELARLWKSQRGKCALSGQRLARENAHLDHKLPKRRGGGDSIENLQWLSREVNMAKRDMTDAEFIAMCANVMSFIGQRIEAAS